MDLEESRLRAALEATEVVRAPKQKLATFGATNLRYFMVSEPVYSDLVKHDPEAVIREGRIMAKRPEIVTPAYMLNLFGFGTEARRSLALLAERFGPNSPGLQYSYHNEAISLNIVGGEAATVAQNIKSDVDGRGENLAVVIRGPGELWDVSLLRFIFEYTAESLASNVGEMMGQRLLEPEPTLGIPRGGAQRIERLFVEVERGESEPAALKQELDRWGLFSRYEDRFLALFRR